MTLQLIGWYPYLKNQYPYIKRGCLKSLRQPLKFMPGCLLNIFRQIGIAVISEKITHAFAESRYGREKNIYAFAKH